MFKPARPHLILRESEGFIGGTGANCKRIYIVGSSLAKRDSVTKCLTLILFSCKSIWTPCLYAKEFSNFAERFASAKFSAVSLTLLCQTPLTPQSQAQRCPLIPQSQAQRCPLKPQSQAQQCPLIPESQAQRYPLIPEGQAQQCPLIQRSPTPWYQ